MPFCGTGFAGKTGCFSVLLTRFGSLDIAMRRYVAWEGAAAFAVILWGDASMDRQDIERAVVSKLQERGADVLNPTTFRALFDVFPGSTQLLGQVFLSQNGPINPERRLVVQQAVIEMVRRIDKAISSFRASVAKDLNVMVAQARADAERKRSQRARA
jgi:hypothetical protein